MNRKTPKRIEKDSFGKIEIPAGALWGANTERARRNLPISDIKIPMPLIHSIAHIKASAALAAASTGHLDGLLATAIERAALDVANGKYDDQFPLNIFQTGSGTSSNMNVNEVVANLANISLGGKAGEYKPVHPNDHVNFGQSSNDVIPSALHIASASLLRERLLPSLARIIGALRKKATKYDGVIKIGRTHLQDALPVTFGNVFRGYAGALSSLRKSLKGTIPLLCVIPLGGTAVGTGFQAPKRFPELTVKILSRRLGLPLKKAVAPLVYMAGRPAISDATGRLSALSAELFRIANDIRFMASGPRLGLGEIEIPPLQPGSSIMPGKVNPVVCEAMVQVSLFVSGLTQTVILSSSQGQFELNTTFPITAYGLITTIEVLSDGMDIFREKAIEGLSVNKKRSAQNIEQSLALATALISKIGYAKATEVAKLAYEKGITVADAAVEMRVVGKDEIGRWLNPRLLLKPGRI
ncbi:MAG: class II fumarate hydratase [Myxococcota bacterium]